MKIPRLRIQADPSPRQGRRQFLKYLAAGACLVPIVEASSRILAKRDATSSLCAPSNSSVLTTNDFSYLGYYDVQLMGLSSPYAQALTHRYVGNDLRFLTIENGAPNALLREWSIAGKSFGDTITVATGEWDNPWGNSQGIGGYFFGLWWDEERNRLWSTHAFDYTYEVRRTQVFTRSLRPDGTISDLHGPVGLTGISAKRAYGGAQAVPAWFQARYGVGPYVIGWGGYTSIVSGGGIASLGPTMYGIQDPAQYRADTDIPTSEFKVIMDSSAGTVGTDWYGSGAPSAFDRGVRLSRPINYYDGGDYRNNPQTAPTAPPQAGAQWLSPAPDGLGRFVWGDSYYNTGCWIDTPSKQGFIAIASLAAGKAWYANSTLNSDSREFELHIFDPVDLGAASQGQRPPWVKPAGMMPLTLPGLGGRQITGNSQQFGVGGATFDPVTKRLFVFAPAGGGTYVNRLYVYSVNA